MNTSDVTLYLGGTRSGKSARAEERALKQSKGAVLYVATAALYPGDRAMALRIQKHRERRPEAWQTLECPLHLASEIASALPVLAAQSSGNEEPPTILIDCVTIWVSNILCSVLDSESMASFERAIDAELLPLLALMQTSRCRWIFVSGETGLGGIGASVLERNFDDGLGLVNQRLAAVAQEVFLVVAGRLLRLEA